MTGHEVRTPGPNPSYAQNRDLSELTHGEIYKAFENTPFTPSNHAIKRLKDVRTGKLGVRSLNEVANIVNNGVLSDGGKGLIDISLGRFKAVVDPRTSIIVTLTPK